MKSFPRLLIALLVLLMVSSALADQSDMNKKVLAPTFVVFDLDDPENYIYAKKPDTKIMPASTTKIMTCILALEHCPDLSVIVSVPDTAVRLKSTNTLMGLKRGESLPLNDLLYGMMLPSGNDAAITVATYVAGSVEDFAVLMNEKAAELKMENTHFTNASGVYNGQHYSTARDMGRLAAYALKNDTFRQIVSTAEYDVPANDVRKTALHLVNTNRLVSDPVTSDFYYEYAIGCKTGSTEKGGKCLVAAAEKNGVTLVAILLGVKDGGDKSTRIRRCFSDAKMMFENIYETMYSDYTVSDLGISSFAQDVSVENATKRNGETGVLSCAADMSGLTVYLSNEKAQDILANPSKVTSSVEWENDAVTAPVKAGDVLGNIVYQYDGKQLFSAKIVAQRDVEEHTPEEDITPTPEPTPVPTPSAAPETVAEATDGPVAEKTHKSRYAIVLAVPVVLIVIVLVFLLKKKH